jgi:hypothetical protein
MIPRHLLSPSRWAWTLPLAAAGFAAACEDSLSVNLPATSWGFVEIAAATAQGGGHQTLPEAFFFRGRLGGIPRSDLAFDSCNTVAYTATGGGLTGVTYMDAGAQIGFTLGGASNPLDRITDSERTYYEPAGGALTYTPGDSVVIDVPGAAGGFPSATIRAKTAEPFTMSEIDLPTGTEAIELDWTPASGSGSSMVVSLRFVGEGSTTFNRQVLCTFRDDGSDSIKFAWYGEWAAAAERDAISTRLRTNYTTASGSATLGVVSTYQVPTPNVP